MSYEVREFGGVTRPCILFGSRVFHLRHRTSTSTSTSTSSDRAYDIGGSRCVISLYQPSALVELELELIQSHMAQKPMLRGEVRCACVAREVSVERGGMDERGCARRLGGWVWV